MSLLHIHKRKRAAGRALHSYPATSRGVRALDAFVYAAGIISPMMAIPQIWLIFSEKTAAGISPVSWIAFALLNIPWIIYGTVHKETPLILNSSLWFICNSLVFLGALLY